MGEGRGGTFLYKLFRYVQPQRVRFVSLFCLKIGIDFYNFVLQFEKGPDARWSPGLKMGTGRPKFYTYGNKPLTTQMEIRMETITTM